MKTPKVYVGLSGGVDSSVAAALLKEQGYDVVGVYLKNWSDDSFGNCPWEQELADAKAAAKHIGVPIISWNFEREYRAKVIEYFFAEYAAGRTPNPDVVCNKEIKFGLFLNKAFVEGADFVATGHYARIIERSGKKFLAQPKDLYKDQTYFLYTLTDEQLDRVLFPLADITKVEVRAIAKGLGLPNAEKLDSQGICFVGEVNVVNLLKSRLPENVGPIITTDGNVIGQHSGAWFYTIGQRHGLGVGGGIPYYVVAKDMDTNTLTVAAGDGHPALYTRRMIVDDLIWRGSGGRQRVEVRIRHGAPLVSATLSIGGNRGVVCFSEEQRAVTPGQAAVVYTDGVVLGGGVITEEVRSSTIHQPHRLLIH
jgi:tRNA-specific 2-thiouridylase